MARYFNDFFGPLRRWCHAILPTVYDDSLSYYEVLCKLSRHVNDLGDIINNIINTGSWNATIAYTRPEFFGAAGNGVTDDSQAVQAAIDDGVQNNKFVLLSANYLIGETLEPSGKCVIIGQNDAKLISEQKTILGFVPTTIINIGYPIYINGVTFDGAFPVSGAEAVADAINHNPLVRAHDANNVCFEGCNFVNYESNWGAGDSAYYSALVCKQCTNVVVKNCDFTRIHRDASVFQSCEYVVIDSCNFNMGNDVGKCYSDIGLALTNNVKVSNCRIVKGDDLTTSPINAMGNYIVIEDCYIKAINSEHGIDYGNEVGVGFTATDLTVRGCTIWTVMWPAEKTVENKLAAHDNVKIYNNTFYNNGLSGSVHSGLIMVRGYAGEHFEIFNNLFLGSDDGPYAISLGHEDAEIRVSGNVFKFKALRLWKNAAGLTIDNNTFYSRAFFVGQAGAEQTQELVLIGCRCASDTGNVVSNSNFNIVCVGCYLATGNVKLPSSANYSRVDNSLSWITAVGKGGEIPENPED